MLTDAIRHPLDAEIGFIAIPHVLDVCLGVDDVESFAICACSHANGLATTHACALFVDELISSTNGIEAAREHWGEQTLPDYIHTFMI